MKTSLQQIICWLLCSGLAMAHHVSGQEILTKPISLEVESSSLKSILSLIEDQAKIHFVYSTSNIDVNQTVSLKVTNTKLESVLNDLLKPLSISYGVVGNRIMLKSDRKNTKSSSLSEPDPSLKTTGRLVNGTVMDEKKSGLSGVNVLLKGTRSGTTTDKNGKFSINIDNDNSVLVFSFVGYGTQEVPVGNRDDIEVFLAEDNKNLTEVLVVGYGTQKKINQTGAIDVIKGDALINRPTTTLSQTMQGKTSGVNFSAGSYGFEPGAALGIQIRGQGAPLVLIDNVVGSLNGLNPNDVESISVLKDAAASAIYGARAPYGVVLITTKSGSNSNKINIEFSASTTSITPYRMPHLADSYTTALALNEAAANTKVPAIYTNATIERILAYQKDPINTPETVPSAANAALWANLYESNANYDWFNVYYGKGNRNQQNIALSGGSKTFNFYLSAGRQYDGGVLQVATDNYKRYNTIAKFEANLTNWLKLSSNSRYYTTARQVPAYDNQGNYDLLFHQVARTFPSQYMKSPNGVYSIQSKIPWTNNAGNETTRINDFVQRFALELTPLKNWTVNADFTYQLTASEFTSNNFTVYEDAVNGTPIVSGSTAPAYVAKAQNLYLYTTLNAFTTYKFDIADKHHVSVLGGYQQEKSKTAYLYAKRNNLVSSEVPSIRTSTGPVDAIDSLAPYGTQGFFSRLTYNFKERYLFEFNSRYDGTYKFAQGKRWGFFPSLSAGWNMSEERFWSPIANAINNFKVRGSWGQLGNQLTAAAYQDIPLIGTSSNLAYIINGVRPSYTTPPNLINPDITWETVTTSNLGIDIGLLRNRLQLTTEVYRRKTTDQLGPSQALPAVLGATIPQSNNMETATNGWEFNLTWNDRIGKDFSYSITGMMFDYLTKITKYNNPTKLLTNPYAGKTQGEIWGLVSEGLIRTQEQADLINRNGTQKTISGQVWNTGDMQYGDLNADGVINYGNNTVDNPGDRKIIGNNTPRYQFGLTLAAKWKGFDFSMFWQGSAKRDLDLSGNFLYGFSTTVQGSIFPDHLDYYRDSDATKYAGLGKNMDAYFPRPYLNADMNNKNQLIQTRYLQNGAYARLKNIQLGYTVPASVLEKIKLRQVYVYLSGENLITLTKLPPHFDPETANVGVRGNGKSYFSQQALTMGINLKF
ncbi:TonB-dependent receptor [Spirosoma endbachense]|nr:TonB-dependent receptor [Spirosoma endbachense]